MQAIPAHREAPPIIKAPVVSGYAFLNTTSYNIKFELFSFFSHFFLDFRFDLGYQLGNSIYRCIICIASEYQRHGQNQGF